MRVRELDGGAERWEGYDHLMVATGAVPSRPDLPGADAAGVHGVQVLGDGIEIRRELEARAPRRAVVVGGGYIGLEMAEALVMRGVEVTLVDGAEQPMRTLDPDMGALVADALRGVGVRLRLGERVEGFDTEGGRVTAVRASGGVLPADLVILGLGVRPDSALADAAGIPVGPTGGIVTDRRMRTGAERVWAVSDCVETRHLVSGGPVAIALGTHANKQGRVAGINLGGGYATFPGVVGTAVSKICKVEVARTGLNEAEAAAAGFAALSATVQSTTRVRLPPGRHRDADQARRRAAHRTAARRADRGGGGRGQTRRRPGHRALERDDGRGDDRPRPRLRATVLPGLGPGPHRRPQDRRTDRGGHARDRPLTEAMS